MSSSAVEQEFTIRRKVLTMLGAKFHIYNRGGQLIGFSKQRAFKLKEDIRVYADESMSKALLAIAVDVVVEDDTHNDATGVVFCVAKVNDVRLVSLGP